MRKLLTIIVPVGTAALVVSCMTFATTLSDEAQKANITVATNPGVVANSQFLNGWTANFGSAYDAQQVGVLTANDIAQKGWRDVCVLIQLVSRGNANASTYDIEAHLNMWQISIFRSHPQPAAPDRENTSFVIAKTGTPSQVRDAMMAGADPNIPGSNGMTGLMYAAGWNQDPAVVTTLLEARAVVNAHDNYGFTSLMYAAEFNQNPEIVLVLLRAGADAKAKDRFGKTAFDYAQSNEKLKGTEAYQQLQEAPK